MLFDEMREAVESMLDKIHHHPFNLKLADGTLPQDKFVFYLEQDALYLADFSRALALTGARMSHSAHAEQFVQFAAEALAAEKLLHRDYLNQYKIHASHSSEKMPACFMYTNYLLSTTSLASVEEAAASVLPCFWVYREVVKKMLSYARLDENPYYAWIALYSGEEFDLSVNTAIDIVNRLGEKASVELRQKMIEAFMQATRLEWLFWDAAYHMKTWQMDFQPNLTLAGVVPS